MSERSRALDAVRDQLERVRYPLVDFRLSLELPPTLTGFPPFDALRDLVEKLDPAHRALFRLLRLGESVSEEELLQDVGEPLIAALRDAELLVPGASPETRRTPNLLLVPAEGLLLLASIPESYPTAGGSRDVWFDLSATVVARALPGSLAGARALDVCSGTGVQALLCARRGASRVVGLDVSEGAVATARANAILNRQGAVADFCGSDMLAALGAGERFDYFVCNAPYAPVLEDGRAPAGPADLGNAVVWRLLDALPAHLDEQARGVIGLWRSIGHRGSTYQLQEVAARLSEHGFRVSAYVDPAPDSPEGVLQILRADLAGQGEGADEDARVRAAERLFDRPDLPFDGFYNQLVFVEPGRSDGAPPPPLFGVGIRSPAAASLR